MDLNLARHVSLSWDFFFGLLSIVFIDLILAGDNAVVIALAVRGLPLQQRRLGIVLGGGIAVILRIVITFFAIQLLEVRFVKLAGGALILWIAVKLFSEAVPTEESRKAQSLWQAIWIITLADVTMSADNILAVAGVSKGNLFLLIFGLGLSIPFVIFSSGLLSRLMDRYPIIILIGAAILGRVGGEMIVTDPLTLEFLRLPVTLQYCVQAICAVGVILIGKRLIRSRSRLEPEKILRYPEVKSLDPEKGDKRD